MDGGHSLGILSEGAVSGFVSGLRGSYDRQAELAASPKNTAGRRMRDQSFIASPGHGWP